MKKKYRFKDSDYRFINGGYCGYIKENGDLIFLKEYHGEDPTLRNKGYIEFSNTHYEDICIRIFKQPTSEQYVQLRIIINDYLNSFDYCKVEIMNDFYKVFSFYEGACDMYGLEEVIGNWDADKLIRIIKNYF